MISFQIIDYSLIIAFWLTFCRFIAIFFQLPVFDQMPVPDIIKILTSLLFAYALFPHVKKSVMADIQFLGEENFWVLSLFYTLSGIVIGHFVKMIMSLFISSGSIITQQIGLGAVRYFDISSGSQIGPFESLIQYTVVVLILTSGALIPMFKGTLLSFDAVNILNVSKILQSPLFFIEQFKAIFASALMLASPLIFTNMLVNTILGVLARTVPQMNIIMVSFVINIALGLLVFMAVSEEFFTTAYRLYAEQLGRWFQFFT